MTQKDKELLLKDICGRLPYGVKVLCEGWDSDHGCEFNTVEDLIGIDDKFIHTLWRGEKDKHSIVEPLSITDYKPYLRPMSSMTDEEREEYGKVCELDTEILANHPMNGEPFPALYNSQDWLNKNMFDYRGLIPMGLALEDKEGMYNN